MRIRRRGRQRGRRHHIAHPVQQLRRRQAGERRGERQPNQRELQARVHLPRARSIRDSFTSTRGAPTCCVRAGLLRANGKRRLARGVSKMELLVATDGWGNPAGRVNTPVSPVLPLEGAGRSGVSQCHERRMCPLDAQQMVKPSICDCELRCVLYMDYHCVSLRDDWCRRERAALAAFGLVRRCDCPAPAC